MLRLPDHLPSLKGRRATAARAAYATFAALLLVSAILSVVVSARQAFVHWPVEARYGVRVLGDPAGRPTIGRLSPTTLRAGLRAGDRVVAVNGVRLTPLSTAADAGEIVARTQGDLLLETQGATGPAVQHRLSPIPASEADRDPRSGLPFGAAAAIAFLHPLALAGMYFAVSLILALRRPQDPEAMLLAFGFVLLAWNALDFGWLDAAAVRAPALMLWVERFVLCTGFWAMLVGIVAFPDGRFTTLWARLAWMVPTTYLIANSATNFVLFDRFQLFDQLLNLPIFVAIVGPVLLRFRQTPPGVQRQQIKWALFGGAVMILAIGVRLLLLDPAVAGRLNTSAYFLLNLLQSDAVDIAFPTAVLVSLLRFRLYDADAVITRSTVYAGMALGLVAVFACSEKLIELLSEKYLGQSLGALAGGLSAALSAVTIAPLHHRITEWTEHRFRHDLTELRRSLPVLAATLWGAAAPAEIAETTLKRTIRALHATRAALVGADGRVFACDGADPAEATPPAAEDEASPLFPFRLPLAPEPHAEPVAWLLLGPRPDGSLYGRDQREAVDEVAGPVAQALLAALRQEARDAEARKERDLLLHRLSVVEDALVALAQTPAGARAASG